MIKRILCLANSKKNSGRCLAGREILTAGPGPWIRPVSARPTEEVSEYERQYQDGTDPRVLDLIDIPLIEAKPHACQSENWLLEADSYWVKAGQVNWAQLQQFVEAPPTLWSNCSSTNIGLHDEMPRALADALPNSLHLIHVRNLQLQILVPGAAWGNYKKRVQGRFTHNGVDYWLWVTDPVIERQFLAREERTYDIGECCLCVSLGEPFKKSNSGDEFRYKLVAAVIQREPTQ